MISILNKKTKQYHKIFFLPDIHCVEFETFFKQYHFVDYINSGRFGKVLKIKEMKSNTIQAVKIMELEKKKRTSEIAERENDILTSITHEKIVKKYQTILSNEYMLIVMEYIEGITLREFLEKQPENKLSENQVKIIMKQLFQTISYFHSLKIIHRDMTLNNIMLRGSCDEEYNQLNIVVIDFGSGKQLIKSSKTYTTIGTEHYITPEMLNQTQYDGFKSDIWNCGVLMFTLAIGRHPFYEKGVNSKLNSRLNIKDGNIVAYKQLEQMSDSFQDLISNMLNVDESERFSIEDCLEHEFITLKHSLQSK